MKFALSEVADLIADKIDVRQVDSSSYITTENMVADRGGVGVAKNIPMVGKVTKYEPGDVLVSNIRPYFKKIWLANKYGGASNDVLIFRAKENIIGSKYLYYVLANNSFFNYVMASAKGAKMPRGDKSQILKYEIDLPDLDTQKKIAATLSAFDDKIELNHQMNKTLEEMGRALFRHYFIDNPEAKNWPVGKLSDVADVVMGQSPPGNSYNTCNQGIPFFQGRKDFGWRFPEVSTFTIDAKKVANHGDVLLSVRAPVGDVNQAVIKCCIGRGLSAISSKHGYKSYCYYLIREIAKRRLGVYNNEGTVYGSVKKGQLDSMPIVIPPVEIQNEFDDIAQRIDSMSYELWVENTNLAHVRNVLSERLIC